MARSDLNKQRGQLLIEAMVAVSLMFIGLLGIFAVLSRSLGLSRVAADQFVAVNLASEGIELSKNFLDSNYIQGNAFNNPGFTGGETTVGYDSTSMGDCDGPELYFDSDTGFYSCKVVAGVFSNYSRAIDIINEGNRVKVISTVTWTTRGGSRSKVSVEDHFYSWRFVGS
jgi:hypothetical protein